MPSSIILKDLSTKTIMNWDQLYQQNVARLIGVCRRYITDIQKAEDLVHDAFMIAIRKQHSYSGKGAIEGWIQKIVINEALQELRKNQKPEHRTETLEGKEAILNEEIMEGISIYKGGQLLSMNFSVSELLNVIDQLPEHHKSVFNLYVLDGFKHNEIATMLEISAGTSKSHLARARKSIQNILIEKSQKQSKRSFSWLAILLLFKTTPTVDSIYQNAFKNYKIEPVKPLNFADLKHLELPKTNNTFLNLPLKLTLGVVSLVIITSTLLFLNSNSSKKQVLLSPTVAKDNPLSTIHNDPPKPSLNQTDTLLKPGNTIPPSSTKPLIENHSKQNKKKTIKKDSISQTKPVIIKTPVYKHKQIIVKKPRSTDSI